MREAKHRKPAAVAEAPRAAARAPLDEIWSARRRTIAAMAAFVAASVFALFLPALRNGFVNWDDNTFVYDNPGIRRFDGSLLSAAFQFRGGNWCPVTWMSHALDHALWGLRPAGHHLTSVILHAVNAALFALVA